VIEMVLAISAMLTLLMPAVVGAARVMQAQRQADNTAHTLARAWVHASGADRAADVQQLRQRLVSTAALPMTFHVTCSPGCTDPVGEIWVTATVSTGVVGLRTVTATASMVRDAYAS